MRNSYITIKLRRGVGLQPFGYEMVMPVPNFDGIVLVKSLSDSFPLIRLKAS